MPSLKDTRRRISSVKNTQKITNAMKLVSAAKFARANRAVKSARPYVNGLEGLVNSVLKTGKDLGLDLLTEREEKKVLIIVVATDRGLCGGLNTQLFKKVERFFDDRAADGSEVESLAWGKRAGSYLREKKTTLRSVEERLLEKPDYRVAANLAEIVSKEYLDRKVDAVYFAFSKFQSALSQEPVVEKHLPIVIPEGDQSSLSIEQDYVLEPKAQEMLEPLLKKYLASRIYRLMLEAAASEHGARMTAMDSASNNAKEVIRKLTIQYNRARQAAITKELIEITSGAEAL